MPSPPPIVATLLEQLNHVILGNSHATRLALACILAKGHLLIEDLPGVGKTTLAHALARSLGLQFQRIQFTSDLLPADVLGASIYDRHKETFQFHPGPIFAQIVLADEINRATPKTQSALLEAMEEQQVTIDRTSHTLPDPFFVIATQNPSEQTGTYPLPESQLDRFLMRISLGYPSHDAERKLLADGGHRTMANTLKPVVSPAQLQEMFDLSAKTHIAPALLDYVQALIEASRHRSQFTTGLSPRAGLGLLSAARAWAYTLGRNSVLPEDIQSILIPVAAHRLRITHQSGKGSQQNEPIRQWIESVPIP